MILTMIHLVLSIAFMAAFVAALTAHAAAQLSQWRSHRAGEPVRSWTEWPLSWKCAAVLAVTAFVATNLIPGDRPWTTLLWVVITLVWAYRAASGYRAEVRAAAVRHASRVAGGWPHHVDHVHIDGPRGPVTITSATATVDAFQRPGTDGGTSEAAS